MSIRGVFFDLYGTLLIYGDMRAAWADWLGIFHATLRPCGLRLSREALAHRCDGFYSRPEPPPDGTGATLFERRIRGLCRSLGLEVPAETVSRIADTSAAAWQRHLTLDPEALPLLRALRDGYTLALITNFDHPPHVHRVLAESGLADCFERLVVSAAVGLKKPDPRIFRVALGQTGPQADEVVFVGDAAEDVEGARAAGLHPVLIAREPGGTGASAFDFQVAASSRPPTPLGFPDGLPVISRLSSLPPLLESLPAV